MKIRKSVAAITLAGAALFVATGCSDSSDTVDEATSKVSTAVESAASEVSTAAGDAIDQVTGLNESKAQDILRKAIDPATPAEEIDKVVDVSNPVTKTTVIAFAKGASAAGYTPDKFEVKDVAKDGDTKATATVAVTSPNSTAPVDIQLAYVKVDGDWKLSSDAVTQLASMAQGQQGN
ncbi:MULTISPECIES: DUF4878 domain-containing protein [Gordonia]|uniref:DUF4878 domain-containing protein n=1 Tax=Gordonia amicalis TaxID=89053 RepID=A0AAE4R3S9_9ACTN|nr:MULTISPECIES: DUF4878 domain-containing protein [Gordonia]ATD71963.1 DUF4878 domain-containing protein [Gordonia sp. 1D]MCZ4650702.1 DUF4878 domain-containing protein [Gordonia amicalis]MDJ0451698.1 DUF4878 domain-containing protein [Gordonia amicalis]MDV6306548.1 DUF4878 domain-containing protein [Gordonia amicalis]MDV6311277.1 DUF4878 domain-containing protein [Gordonia amicalis]